MSDLALPAVSVVIPAYNRGDTIVPAAQSVLAQTFEDFELIVVDDASSDDTVAQLETIADPRLRVIVLPKNVGASVARNEGIQVARGPWVAFHDSDDLWLPGKLAAQMARLTVPGAAYVAAYCGMEILADGQAPGAGHYHPPRDWQPREGDLLKASLTRSYISTQTLVARRKDLLAVGGFDAGIPALIDWDCVLHLAARGPIALVDEIMVHQRFSPNSITKSDVSRLAARHRMLKTHEALLARHPKALAWHHYTIAGAERQAGNRPAAKAHLTQAIAYDPANLRHRAMALAMALGLR